MAGQKAKGSKKTRKYGRHKKWCERYKFLGRREINKALKLMRHLRKHEDRQAGKALINLPESAKREAERLYRKVAA